VLTIGEIGLRKGAPYVLGAAKLLQGRAQFRMVGSINIRPEALQQLQAHLEVLGPVPRCDILSHYAWADVFLLPSLCEGSAEVTYEALACGVPVIATPNTGSMVCDGLDGFIVPIRDKEAIAAKLDLLMNNPGLLEEMSRGARLRARQGTITAYAQRLSRAMGNLADEVDQP
jgi:glycosyltransferase involved in cell wall biosynthesis